MQIVTDSGFDLSPQQKGDFKFHALPLKITLSGVSYRSSIDIQSEEFYTLLKKTGDMPITSTPSPGEFLEIYEKVAEKDPDILSIHISSGLSGTYNSARTAVEQFKGANITLVDTRSLSVEMGWQLEAAIKAVQAGWPVDKILELLTKVREASEVVFTLPDLSYLIHGGRISHLKGLLASLLGIKPLIGVDKADGKYYDRGKARTFKRAVQAIPTYIANRIPHGTTLRAQIAHANNPEGAIQLRQEMDKLFSCKWLQECSISPVLGAHTGQGLVGVVFAPLDQMPKLP
ncbi:MAG: DegV family protein [Brevefilum sp.]|nr:DegV family protein [Brevefilum sp.]